MKPYYMILSAALLGAGTVATAADKEAGMSMHSGGSMSMSHMEQMEAHMQEMQKEMAEIKQIKDPAERRGRMQKHLQEMTAMMHKLNEDHPSMSGQEQQLHLKMLESRLDLLQGMLTQVVEVQASTFPRGMEPTD